MSADVRIDIEHNETVLRPVQNKVRFIVLGIIGDQAKHTSVILSIDA